MLSCELCEGIHSQLSLSLVLSLSLSLCFSLSLSLFFSLSLSVSLSLSLSLAKYERFFHKGSVVVATVFAPIVLPPTPVLVFQEQEEGNLFLLLSYLSLYLVRTTSLRCFCSGVHVLVAIGSLHSVNPDRIVCKKIVLSGHPFKIHRRSAVIRYMFFNRGLRVCKFGSPQWSVTCFWVVCVFVCESCLGLWPYLCEIRCHASRA